MTMTTAARQQQPAAVPAPVSSTVAAMGGGDVYARCRTGSSAAGRGSIAGWTPCPLCSPTNNNHLLLLADFSNVGDLALTSTTTNDTNNNNDNSKEDSASNIISSLPTQPPPPPKSNTKSIKLFSHGRGLSAHLHAVHTPWNPGKAELKRRENLIKRMENEARRRNNTNNNNSINNSGCGSNSKKRRHCEIDVDDLGTCQTYMPMPSEKWDPTEDEIKQWNQRVLDIVTLVESSSKKRDSLQQFDQEEGDCSFDARDGSSSSNNASSEQPSSDKCTTNNSTTDTKGRDRSGNVCLSYRNSLPPFLAAAANGDLLALKKCMDGDDHDDSEATAAIHSQHLETSLINNKQPPPLPLHMDSKRREQIKKLLSIRDRNGSTAEHWAAGGGHLECMVYLLDMRDSIADGVSEPTNIPTSSGEIIVPTNTETSSTNNYASKKIRRRRDGKTSLHYAARNGHIDIIDLLLSRQRQKEEEDAPLHVDISSGDGTTPLHMACYGGHPTAVQHLIETHSANIHALNEWECGCAHWAAMSLGNEGIEKVIELCIYLKQRGASFVQRQKQGHTPLHKAASRKNRHVIEWLATSSLFTEEERKVMGANDVGGNCPSDIWLSVGGEEEFGLWMKEKWNW